MVNIEFVAQLVDAMGDAVDEMDKFVGKKKFDEASRLKTFIFDLHIQLDKVMRGQNVRRS